jgi:lipoyl(octanoyl) transferase
VVLEYLQLWIDPVRRDGPATMAVDDWLLDHCEVPLLRVYRWADGWGSLGYFGRLAEARAAVPGVEWVRRRTGGGVVDHRADWTYSLVVPASEPLAGARGDASYRFIHAALAGALAGEGICAELSAGEGATGEGVCFANPVRHDLLEGATGRKLAGAGQRRTRHGLLHQGSVAAGCADDCSSRRRAEVFAGGLAQRWKQRSRPVPEGALVKAGADGYAREEWTARR